MGKMLQYLATDDRIKKIVGVRDWIGLHITQLEHKTFPIRIRMGGRLIDHIQPMTFMAKFVQKGEKKSVPRSHIENSVAITKRDGDVTKSINAALEHIFEFGITPLV